MTDSYVDVDLLDIGTDTTEEEAIQAPYVFIDQDLFDPELELIFKIAQDPDIKEKDSYPFYVKLDGKLNHIGRFDMSNLTNLSRYKILKVIPWFVPRNGVEPVDLTELKYMSKLVRINKG